MTILGKLEQEYLLRTIESGMALAERRQLFLWTQGPLQALLPHDVLLCMQLDPAGALERVECLHRAVFDGAALARLNGALAPMLAASWQAGSGQPIVVDADGKGEIKGEVADQGQGTGSAAACAGLLHACGFDHALVHGSARWPAAGASTVFALLGMPSRPESRHAYFLQLLLPYLHLGLLRVAPRTGMRPGEPGPVRPLSGRELAVLDGVRAGRSNDEVARQLGISTLTVKNHLQRVYRVLGVANRAHAVARCLALRLL